MAWEREREGAAGGVRAITWCVRLSTPALLLAQHVKLSVSCTAEEEVTLGEAKMAFTTIFAAKETVHGKTINK